MKVKRFLKIFVAALLTLSLTVALVGCGSKETATESGKDSSPEKKILKVGTEAAYAPFEYKDKDGNIVGFDAEFIAAVAKEMGYEVEITHIAWEGLIPALQSGAADVVISAMTITDERKKSALFSDPYLQIVQSVAVKEGSPVKSLDDLEGKVIGVQNNTTGHYWVADLYGVKPEADHEKIKKFDTTPDALVALQNSVVEAVVADRPVVLAYIKENPGAKLTKVDSDQFEDEFYGIAMKLGNDDLAQEVNAAIKKVKESNTYDELIKKYFPE